MPSLYTFSSPFHLKRLLGTGFSLLPPHLSGVVAKVSRVVMTAVVKFPSSEGTLVPLGRGGGACALVMKLPMPTQKAIASPATNPATAP